MINGVTSFALEVAVRALLAPSVLASRWLMPAGGHGDPAGHAPRAGLSPMVAAKVVLDEIFFVTEVLSARFVTAADRHRLQAEISDGLAFFHEAGWLDDPTGYFPTPPPLEPRALTTASSFGRAYRHLTFASEYEPRPGEPGGERWHGRTANRTAHAWMLQHPGPPRPWLVCLHGYRTGSPLTGFFQFSPRWLHETLGVNLLLPVLPLHGPRSSGWRSGDGMFSGEILDMVHLQAQAIWDLRRLLAWLRARDGMPIGLYGLSLGGGIAALTAGLESDLACVIAGMPMVDVMGLLHCHVPAFVRVLAERFGISFDHIARLLRIVSPLAMAPRLPAERLFIFGGAADRLVPSRQVSALWQHWGEPRIEWHGGSHTSFGIESKVNLLVSEALTRTRLAERAA
jgi:dienelactone hydrolase